MQWMQENEDAWRAGRDEAVREPGRPASSWRTGPTSWPQSSAWLIRSTRSRIARMITEPSIVLKE
jgi:hypothetical protein